MVISPMGPSLFPEQYSNVEPVRSSPARGHLQSPWREADLVLERAQLRLPRQPRRIGGREARVRAEEALDRVVVLLRQHRAGDIDDAAAGAHETRGAVEDRVLLLSADLEAAGPQTPFRIRVAAPGAGAGAGRVDEHAIRRAVEIGDRVGAAARRSDLDV